MPEFIFLIDHVVVSANLTVVFVLDVDPLARPGWLPNSCARECSGGESGTAEVA